ncbi:CDP-glucose 4,6-dehydratase [Novosphingobium sp.]|uniref:CDP-glucose 4,6-dehydratase n=1 Tax=Novosphingobium sp. TaxID=1874826 RepID=UPI003D103211
MESLGLDRTFWAGRRVLVTGHTGFKGSWLLLMLERLGARVTGLALAPDAPALFTQMGGEQRCQHFIADLRDHHTVATIVQAVRPEIIFHLGAQPLVRRSYLDPIETFSVNVLGTAHLLDAARHVDGLRAVVSVTTDKCYENDGRTLGYCEDARLGGHDPYSNSKACAELVSQCFRDSYFARSGIGLATARAGNVIGGGDYSADRLVVDAVHAFRDNRDLEIRHPEAVRPWQHVLEPLTGYCLLAQRLAADPAGYAGGWNFGPPPAQMAPVSRVVDLLAARWDRAAGYVRQPGDHPHEAAMLTLDSTKAMERLGWLPRLTLEAATAWTADWYRAVFAGEDAAQACIAQTDRYIALGTTARAAA